MTETPTPRATFRGFLFADLRGYSDYVEARGDQAGVALLAAFRDIVRATIGRFDGAEVRTEGDSFYVILPSASSAVGCGMEILVAAAAADPPIRVGIGVHAGEAADTGEGPVGSVVNIAARVCAQAAAGELLVTDTVRAVTRTTVPYGFIARGPRTLKGISESVALYRVVGADEGDAATEAHGTGPTWSRRPGVRVAVVVAVVVLALVGVAVLAQALSRPGSGSTPSIPASSLVGAATATSAPSTAPVITPTSSAPSQEPTAGASTAVPSQTSSLTQAEQDLVSRLAGLTPEERAGCRPGTPDERANGAIVDVTCPLPAGSGADVVHYDLFDQPAIMLTAFDAYSRAHGDPSADCSKIPLGGGSWDVPQVSLGHLLCYPESGQSFIRWTHEGGVGAGLMGSASRRDGDWQALYAWWNEIHPLIAH